MPDKRSIGMPLCLHSIFPFGIKRCSGDIFLYPKSSIGVEQTENVQGFIFLYPKSSIGSNRRNIFRGSYFYIQNDPLVLKTKAEYVQGLIFLLVYQKSSIRSNKRKMIRGLYCYAQIIDWGQIDGRCSGVIFLYPKSSIGVKQTKDVQGFIFLYPKSSTGVKKTEDVQGLIFLFQKSSIGVK